MKSVMSHNFAQVPSVNTPRANFNRSHGLKTTFDSGELVPIFVDEVLPGDTFNLNPTMFGRLATPINPIMDNMFLETFYFFVPTRLVWDNFKKMMGERKNPSDSVDFITPSTSVNAAEGSIADYFGLPTKVTADVNVLPIRALGLIWNEWFRDENLQESYNIVTDDTGFTGLGDGVNSWSDTAFKLPRGKRHDYFTSCLPSPQKGAEVTLPLGQTAPVFGTSEAFVLESKSGAAAGQKTGMQVLAGGGSQPFYSPANFTGQAYIGMSGDDGVTPASLEADLTTATASSINDLRYAFSVQEFLERDARGGTRYTELIRSHFGVTSPDARLQRPEYLGGGSQPININPVAQQSSTDATTPQGNLAAFGTVSAHGGGFTKSFTEHGFIIGLVNVRADLTYQDGLDRMWSRSGRFDYYFPEFAHLGEQEVLNKEIYAQGTAADEEVFGYQERWAEYRYKPSKITGLFRSNALGSLDAWHLSEDFTTLPVLGDTFIQDKPPVDRVVAVPSEPQFILDCYFQLNCARPMPMYSVPGFGGRL